VILHPERKLSDGQGVSDGKAARSDETFLGGRKNRAFDHQAPQRVGTVENDQGLAKLKQLLKSRYVGVEPKSYILNVEKNTIDVAKYSRIDRFSSVAVEAVHHQTCFSIPLVLNILSICNEGPYAMLGSKEGGDIQLFAKEGLRRFKGLGKTRSIGHQGQSLAVQVESRACSQNPVQAAFHARYPPPDILDHNTGQSKHLSC